MLRHKMFTVNVANAGSIPKARVNNFPCSHEKAERFLKYRDLPHYLSKTEQKVRTECPDMRFSPPTMLYDIFFLFTYIFLACYLFNLPPNIKRVFFLVI